MKLPESQPAKSYDLNMLSSLIGRCFIDNLSSEDSNRITELLHLTVSILQSDKPLVPHTDPVLISKLRINLHRLLNVLKEQEVDNTIGAATVSDVQRSILKLLEALDGLNQQDKQLVNLEEIEHMFAMVEIYSKASDYLREELDDKSQYTEHPATPHALTLGVNIEETRRLIELVITDVFAMELPQFSNSLIDKPTGYHLFWTTAKDKINYVTPRHYDLATQLSFDIPHNAAHVAHLGAHATLEVATYIDTMRERAYFESVAVLAEHQFIRLLREDTNFSYKIAEKLDPRRVIKPEEIRDWMLADRIFEARLRVARLLGDCFTLEGYAFEKTSKMVAQKVNLDRQTARSEVYKYYTLTGLGGVYVLGPKKLLENGIKNPKDAILTIEGEVQTYWNNLESKSP